MIDKQNTILKKDFLIDEIWLLSFGGAFQRSGIYKNTATDVEKTNFRKLLRAFIENSILSSYKSIVSEQQHLLNISSVSKYSMNFKEILNNSQINIGISQKLLNLVLKYHWCLEQIVEPPHFPIDRIIQGKIKPILNWTELNNIDDYLKIIEKARVLADLEDKSIAVWELENFGRR